MVIDPVLDISLWITLCSVGFVAGLIDAIAGGGGMLTVPTLLTSGLPPHVALGTNKLAASFGSLTASFTFYRKNLFNPKYWRLSIIATAAGAILGTIIVNFLSVEFLDKYIPVLVVLTAIYTLFSRSVTSEVLGLPIKNKIIKIKQILLSSGLARSTNFVSNFFSLLTFIYLGHVNFVLGISMGIFIMLGAWVGAHWAIKFGSKFIRPVFITVVILMSVNLAYQAWLS